MDRDHIIKSWRNEEYRESLDAQTCDLLPESPVGSIDLSESDLMTISGGKDEDAGTTTLTPLTPTIIEYTVSVVEGGSCRMGTNGCCPAQSS
jgi:mersacidin/lichenicidin family type 2 lantibiotic